MSHSCPLRVEVEDFFNTALVTLTGEVDDSNVSELVDALVHIQPPSGTTVLVDVGQLAFLDACGIQALVLMAWRFETLECTMFIARAGGSTLHVLDAMGADTGRLLLEKQSEVS